MFEKLVTENKALEEKDVVDFIKQWNKGSQEAKDFVRELDDQETLKKLKIIMKIKDLKKIEHIM